MSQPPTRPSTVFARRRMLLMLAGTGLTAAGCTGDPDDKPKAKGSARPGGAGAACPATPKEVAGPHPADGTNGPNVLIKPGIVRADLRTSLGSPGTRTPGVPLRIRLTVQDAAHGCAPRAGAAVYLWQADREGKYSMYSPGLTGQTYLRGVQETDNSGRVTFTSIFPGVDPGRWPHIHLMVFASQADATTPRSPRMLTSQFALPQAICQLVYATPPYAASAKALAKLRLGKDPVLGDSAARQTPKTAGNVKDGFTTELTIGI